MMEVTFYVEPKREGVVAFLPVVSGMPNVMYGDMLFVPASGFWNMQHFPLRSGACEYLDRRDNWNCWKAKMLDYGNNLRAFVYRSGGG